MVREVARASLRVLLILFMCTAGPVVADPFEEANAAFDKTDYATAMRLASAFPIPPPKRCLPWAT